MTIANAAPVKIAVVGLGWWGRVIVPLAEKSPKLKVARAAAHIGAEHEEIFAKQHGLPFSENLEDALRDPNVDAVVLCTPHSQHADQIVQSANAGKHVFCEKPLSLNRADVLRAVEACNRNKVKLAVGHEKRFEPPIQELMKIVKSGELGTPLQIEANFKQDKFLKLKPTNWRFSEKEAPAGPLTATGIHLLDLSIGVFGPAARAFACVKTLGSEMANGDTLGMLLEYKSGANALLGAVLATPFDGRFAVYCSHGWAEVRDKNHPEAPQGWVLTVKTRGEQKTVREFQPSPAVLANLEAFADDVAGRAPYPVPQSEMIANISALEAIIKSARSGRVETVENG
ncbi:MAG TPA: Gfo/Idh/MocA family oxidoreductase [Burkholderiales bacterium]